MANSDNSAQPKNPTHPSKAQLIVCDDDLAYKAQSLPDNWSPAFTDGRPIWIHVDGLGSPDVITAIADGLELHPLIVEDLLSPQQRPKFEDYGETLFIVIKDYYLKGAHRFGTEQIAAVFGKNFILTVQEKPGKPFEQVLARLNRHRKAPATTDLIAYFFIDAVIDHLSDGLEAIGDSMEKLEAITIDIPDRTMLKTVHHLRREMTSIRRSLWPLHEAIGQFLRSGSVLLHPHTQTYLRDVEDHISRAIELVEGYRDSTSEILDLYLSTTSNRMNEVMKLLTIISTIFIPMNFFAAVYGMNFKYMPELDWHIGYPLFWGLIATIAVVMLVIFRKKQWL